MNKYLIALDMDGTLLKSDQTVSTYTIDIINKIINLGHIVIIASGRPLRNIMDTYNLLNLKTPIVAYNGGAIYGLTSGFKDKEIYFNLSDVLKVFNYVGFENFNNYMCESKERIYLKNDNEIFSTWFSYNGLEIVTGDLNETLKENTLSMIYHVNPNNLEKLKLAAKTLSGDLDIRFWSGGSFAELYHKKVDKFQAVKDIADFYNIDDKNIISFGDASNDIPLMQGSYISVAMKNGKESIKDYSKFITEEDNDNDGVAIFLKKFFNL